MAELAYETRADGVLYTLEGGMLVKVRRKSANRVKVSMQCGKVVIPPETGDLDTSAFRGRLVGLAREHFGDVNGLGDKLGLIAVGFDAHCKERKEDAAEDDKRTNVPELVGTPYRIVDGGFVRLKNTREGEIPQRLTNFTARVEEEVVKDDGAEARRVYRVAGKTKDGALPTTDVLATQFGGMNWISDAWGLAGGITAGQGARDYTREAIELLSHGAATRHLYAHTGFRRLPGGKRVFLHAGGAVGGEGVEVELEPGFERYALPAVDGATLDELAGAVRVSLKFLELAPIRVTAPLLGAAYLAPLSEVVVPDFVLWLWGATGSFKSTVAALGLSHFGSFSETTLPLSFESTANALERSLFLLKDLPAVVDDWRPAVSRSDASEMDRKAQRLLRAAGNRQGRGRMTSDTTLRRSYAPRGLVVATAEALPEGPAFESAAARALSINLSRGDVDLEKLSVLQHHKASLGLAMAGYVDWSIARYDELSRRLPAHRDALREEARRDLDGSHPRTPDAVAALTVGLEMLRSYALTVGALNREEADKFFSTSTAGVIEAARAHAEATKGGDPTTRFVEMLRSLFLANKVHVRDRASDAEPEDWAELGWEKLGDQDGNDEFVPERGSTFVGWVDEDNFYFDKDAVYASVAGFAQRGGIPFGIKPRALWRALARSGISLVDAGRTDTLARVKGKPKRVVQIRRAIIHEEGGES